jgi:trehalose 6-phosphate phosphatase
MSTTDLQPSLPGIDFHDNALLLDVDGTLLDIASEPDAVKSAPSLVANLTKLDRQFDGAVAFVSGRTLENLDHIFAPLKLTAIACHGATFREPGGRVLRASPIAPALKARWIAIGKIDPGITVEDKEYSLAFHYRRVPQAEPALLDAMHEHIAELRELGFNLLRGKCVVEIKQAAVNKGAGLRRLMNFRPFAGRQPIFAGDDRTDEDVFAVLPQFGGMGISVGHRIAGAKYMVQQPRDIRHWLARLAEQ